MCIALGGQINFWSHLGEIRPQKSRKFHRTPSRGRIESIKSAGKRSQKVPLITFPRHFLETLISCQNYMPKNSISQVNPLGTSLEVLLISTFCYLCRLLVNRDSQQHASETVDASTDVDYSQTRFLWEQQGRECKVLPTIATSTEYQGWRNVMYSTVPPAWLEMEMRGCPTAFSR